jgi:hypothetical protein
VSDPWRPENLPAQTILARIAKDIQHLAAGVSREQAVAYLEMTPEAVDALIA